MLNGVIILDVAICLGGGGGQSKKNCPGFEKATDHSTLQGCVTFESKSTSAKRFGGNDGNDNVFVVQACVQIMNM